MTKPRSAGLMVITLATLMIISTALFPAPVAGDTRWGAAYFSNIELTTQDGERVKLYDLIKGRIVVIELMYTTCRYACPLETARLLQVQKLLGDRVGRDIFFYSITIDPKHDTPAVLKAYQQKYQTGPGWIFLTGKPAEIELVSRKLGLYFTEPNKNDKDGHTPSLLIGNEATGQWMHASALDNPQYTSVLIRNWMGGWKGEAPARSYAEARPIVADVRGERLFASKCSACHTLGQGTRIGPDLEGVTRVRNRTWLESYILAPDRMLATGDPAAKALASTYTQVRMPNLRLSAEQVADVIAYLETADTRRTDGSSKVPDRREPR